MQRILAPLPEGRPGIRLHGLPGLRELLDAPAVIGTLADRALGAPGKAVRAILFDKSESTNWTLAWHQDRTIAVKRRVEVEGFGPWTMKDGIQHVAPPYSLISNMVTLRIHIDPVPADNAPLLVALGTHRLGRIPEDRIAETIAAHERLACLAAAGDVWVYATPVLHASDAATRPARRRVLQVDYSADPLPGGLEWLLV